MRLMKFLALSSALALALSVAAFAKDKDANSGKFDLDQQARVGSAVLQPGHYEAEWSGPSQAVHVSILSHGKTVATSQGQVKELPEAAPYSAVTVRTLKDQTKQVDEIDFHNRKDALVLSGM